MGEVILSSKDLVKTYRNGEDRLIVLDGLSIDIASGSINTIVGESGSGKSTLLNVLSSLDSFDQGDLVIDGKDIKSSSEEDLSKFRNETIGFIFQFHHLLPEFTAKENVAMPLLIRRCTKKHALEEAEILLSEVGLSKRMMHKPGELSGGERQRTAIARALVTNPSCILADEPTGNLDEKSANEVFELILRLNKYYGNSLIMATHNLELSKKTDQVYELRDGILKTI